MATIKPQQLGQQPKNCAIEAGMQPSNPKFLSNGDRRSYINCKS